ncbi:DUF896 domain-containing protein [Anaeromicropila populeti]|uniref:UPF0291 protein SAMN05661086_02914 n=1 Tax=Anaeromicropila populeti TaxID=37658 RepID=A0A1I6KZE8_9FIRM|nr:DUF896 domain-containing protein [Anaeromicropila populeti]SFR96300.1 Uncharacterized protein YnzC, UPF0291/DUF896 family [Anaeromicropila populeti]
MNEQDIHRINELYHKSQNEGLTPEEKIEQAQLRNAYIQAIRQNMRGTLNNVSVMNPDGTVTDLADVSKKNQKS